MSSGSKPGVGSPNWSISLIGISMKSLDRVKYRFPILGRTLPPRLLDPLCRSIPVWSLVHLAEEDRYNSPTQWRLVWGISSLSALTAKLTLSVYFGIMNCQPGRTLDVLWWAQTHPTAFADVTTSRASPLWQLWMQMPPLLLDFPSWLCRSWHTLWRLFQSYVWSSYLLRWVKSLPLMMLNLILIYILLQFRQNIQKVLLKTPCLNQEEKHACNPKTRSCSNMGLSADKNTHHTLQVSYYPLSPCIHWRKQHFKIMMPFFTTRIPNEPKHGKYFFILSQLNFGDKNSSGTVEMQSRHYHSFEKWFHCQPYVCSKLFHVNSFTRPNRSEHHEV